MRVRLLPSLLLVSLLLVPLALSAPARAGEEAARPRVLVLTTSVGYVHDVVRRPDAETLSHAERKLVEALGGACDVVASQDVAELAPERLAGYRGVVFYTTGELPVDAGTRLGLLDWVERGGAFVGIHPATDTLYSFPRYLRMVGGTFDGHPWHQAVKVRVEDRDHPATRHLGESFEITDEIYQFKDWRRDDVHVLLSLDPASVDLGRPGVHRADRDFALAWTRTHGLGRVFYTALGHRPEVWDDPRFLAHVKGGVLWALAGGGGPGARDAESFVVVHDRLPLAAGARQALPQRLRNVALRLEVTPRDEASGLSISRPQEGEAGLPPYDAGTLHLGGSGPLGTSVLRLPLGAPGTPVALEVVWAGETLTLQRDGEVLCETHGVAARAGPIVLQSEGGAGVDLARVRVRALPEEATGYHVLYGASLAGWKMCGPGAFLEEDAALVTTGGMGMLWHERELVDFVLLLDWKVGRREDNSGVFVRFPDPGDDPWVAVNQGYELQICDAAPEKHRTGSVYSFQDANAVPTNAPGEWNHYEIRVVGQHYTVRVNGQTVNEFDGERSTRGHVGLQNHDDASRVSFRNVRVIELR